MARTPDPSGRRVEDHRVPGHARHARLRGGRGADGQVRHPRHGHGEAGLPRHAGPGARTSSGPWARGSKVALTVLDFGRTTFGASCTGMAKICLAAATRHAAERQPVRPAAGRARAGQEEDRLPGRHRLRHGGDDLRDRRPDRPRHRGLHARDGHPQGLLHRGPLAGRLRDAPGLRRPGLLHRRAVRADDARRADQHDRRGGQRGLARLHRRGRHARRRPGPEVDARGPEAARLVPADALVVQPRAHGPDGPSPVVPVVTPELRPLATASGAPGRAVRRGGRARA